MVPTMFCLNNGGSMVLKNQEIVSKATKMRGHIVSANLDKLYITFVNGDRIGISLYNYKQLIQVSPELEKFLDKKLRSLLKG